MSSLAVEVRNLSKSYRIRESAFQYERLTESLWQALSNPRSWLIRRRPAVFWALKDVSFELIEGEVLGVIGRNGAGKTTLLKILSRITEPTVGEAVLRGRTGALLEVGAGFHPELTGRENIYLNGAVLGMSKEEVRRKFDEIVSFAEVSEFLETPVKRFSSGMHVRLAFSVAAHLEPEILLVDEVLAVGDLAFQRKCLGRMGEVAREGRTVVFVSHNMSAIESLCTRGLLLERGEVVALGDIGEVVDKYVRQMLSSEVVPLAQRTDRKGTGRVRFTDMTTNLRTGHRGEIRLAYESSGTPENVEIHIGIKNHRGEGALFLSNGMTGEMYGRLPDRGSLVCSFDQLGLMPGIYFLTIYCQVNGVVADWITDVGPINVVEGDYFKTGKSPSPGYGLVLQPHHWDFRRA